MCVAKHNNFYICLFLSWCHPPVRPPPSRPPPMLILGTYIFLQKAAFLYRGCARLSGKHCTLELYRQPGSPVGPVQLFSRPARPPSYLPSLSTLWKSPADLQPSCWSGHSENVRCRTKCLVASKFLQIPLYPCSCIYKAAPCSRLYKVSLETSCSCRLQFHRQFAAASAKSINFLRKRKHFEEILLLLLFKLLIGEKYENIFEEWLDMDKFINLHPTNKKIL